MYYYYTLWYPNNPVILNSFDLYFQKLLSLYKESDMDERIKNGFMKLSHDEQYGFLLKSDISYLLKDIQMFNNKDSLAKLIQQSKLFINGRDKECVFSLGNTIPWTKIKLTISDFNRNNHTSTHPDHDSWNMIWWWEKTEEEWMEIYAKTLNLLKKINEDFYNEINFIIQKIVPFNTSYNVHNSCSYKENIWTLYLWYTVDIPNAELCILEALIHESSHNKLNLIMQSDELILNDKAEKYYSPYRPDARHIYWIYLWVHALVPTIHTLLWAIKEWHVTDIRWHEKALLYHFKNKIWMKVLKKYAQCTDLWYQILEELEVVIKLCDKIIILSPEIKRLDFRMIQSLAKEHFLDVQNNYPHLEY